VRVGACVWVGGMGVDVQSCLLVVAVRCVYSVYGLKRCLDVQKMRESSQGVAGLCMYRTTQIRPHRSYSK